MIRLVSFDVGRKKEVSDIRNLRYYNMEFSVCTLNIRVTYLLINSVIDILLHNDKYIYIYIYIYIYNKYVIIIHTHAKPTNNTI